MNKKTIMSVAAACLAAATVVGAAALPSDVRAADPVSTQGTPSFFASPKYITASIGGRWVGAQVTSSGVGATVGLTGGSPAGQWFNTWNVLTCSGGAAQQGQAQPLTYSGVTTGTNVTWCPWPSTPAWIVAMVDLL